MFCNNCGQQLPEQAAFCSGCGATLSPTAASPGSPSVAHQASNLGQVLGSEVKARSKDAWEGIKLFAKSPVGGLQASFEMFDSARALSVAIVFAILYEAMLFIGLYHGAGKMTSYIPFLPSMEDLSVKRVVQIIAIGLTPVITLAVSATLARLIFRGKGTFVGDLYTASASLLPYGVLVLVASILGPANIEVIAALTVFALTYNILMLYAGCSRISGIPEAGAAPAVPVMLLLTVWLTKVVVSTMVF